MPAGPAALRAALLEEVDADVGPSLPTAAPAAHRRRRTEDELTAVEEDEDEYEVRTTI